MNDAPFDHDHSHDRPRPGAASSEMFHQLHDHARAHHTSRGFGDFGRGLDQMFGAGFGPGLGRGFGGPRARRPKGDVRLAIISLLSESENNGYGLMKLISERSEGEWNPSPGSVYPTLQQLVEEGLVDSQGEGRSTTYLLTAEGRAYAAEHADKIAEVWNLGDEPSNSARELFESAGKLMRTLGQFRVGVTEQQRGAAAEVLTEARRKLHHILAE